MTLNMANKFGVYSVGGPFRENKESIHSGQFMVSHFEEVQDDDNGIEIPDPDNNIETPLNENLNKPNLCQEVQLYIPKCQDESGKSVVTSHLEIETSLTKLFNCMNLAYRQKLTSPKWNHFKGVRLRWKDKIRLNNVIWRCWHMQFILKRRTPVCQFASPLDVDVHSNPQSVVLEGKYWKRQLDVIKAEYRKWRRNFKTNVAGFLPYDTISELDFMELSSLSYDKSFFQDDLYSDTLFSSIIEPFPFPDRREIARSANNADLLQPNLGALQPNLDDIDLTFQELLQNARLPPVPEEGADEIMKGVDYNFSAIMDSEEMDTTSSVDPSQTSVGLCTKSYETTTMSENIDPIIDNTNDYSNQLLSQSSRNLLLESLNNLLPTNTFPTTINNVQIDNQDTVPQTPNFPSKTIIKGRITKPLARPFRREPHNYDKAQPTLHQTNMYQQMLAEQQQQQQLAGPSLQYNQKYSNIAQQSNNFQQSSENNTLLHVNSNMFKSFSIPQVQTTKSLKYEPRFETSQSQMLNMLNFNINQDQFQNNITQVVDTTMNKMVNSNLRKTASTGDYINVPATNILCNVPVIERQLTNPNLNDASYVSQQIDTSKVIFRSNSLPINSSIKKLQSKDENFAVPKYSLKSNRSRTRSHSAKLGEQNQAVTYLQSSPKSQLQAATSEPMLNSTLAQLLTTNNQNKNLQKCSSSTNVISNSLPPSGFHLSTVSSSSNNPTAIPSTSNQIPVPNIALSTKSNSLPQNLLLNNPTRPTISSAQSAKKHNMSSETYISDQDCNPNSPSRTNVSANTKFPRENQRRAGHIHAEQKRRYNIKNGFDLLYSLIPQLQQNPNAKLSKAAMLQKGAEHIKQLRSDRNSLHEKMDALSKERDSLNSSLSHLHSILPANGAPVSRQRTERVKQLYNQYVRYRTMENWKFWILGLILEPLLNSYTTTVSTASIEELHRTALHWVDQYCSLIELRPGVSNKLRYLSMTTDILSDPPSTLQEEVIRAINNTSGQHPNLNNS